MSKSKSSPITKEFILGLDIDRINSSATLFQGSQIVAHVEEERFIRIKRAPNCFPINAIKYCLSLVPNGLTDIAAITLGFDHDMFTHEVPLYFLEEWSAYPEKPPESLRFEKYYLTEKHPELIRNKIQTELNNAGLSNDYFPPVHHYGHHYCHALCAHITSPFESSLGIVADGNSELDTYSVWDCQGTKLQKIFSKTLPNSLGWLYRTFTEFCGFEPNGGEGKLMGLAPYGKRRPEIQKKISQIISWTISTSEVFDFNIDASYIYLSKRHKKYPKFTQKFIDLFGEPALSNNSFSSYYQDIAWAIQDAFEIVLTGMARRFLKHTGHKNLTLSGGVALNCKVNGFIWQQSQDLLEDIYIFPMSGDDGIGYGSNLAYSVEHISTKSKDYDFESAFLGPQFTNEQIVQAVSTFDLRADFQSLVQFESLVQSLDLNIKSTDLRKVSFNETQYIEVQEKAKTILNSNLTFHSDVAKYAAHQLSLGKVISWFQGEMEAGPRALGNRSILADPRDASNRDRVNEKVKFRELWRPFCPSVLQEHSDKYFELPTQCPFMINTFHVTPETKLVAPAIVHVDGTARPQFVTLNSNPKYYELIHEFYNLTGLPMLLNTSMNIKGEPICCTPNDALQLYLATDIDILILGDYSLNKSMITDNDAVS